MQIIHIKHRHQGSTKHLLMSIYVPILDGSTVFKSIMSSICMVLPTDIAHFLLIHMHANTRTYTCTHARTHKHHHNLQVHMLDHPILPYKCIISHHTEVLYQQIAGKHHQCKWQWVKIRHYAHLDEHVLWQTARYAVELFCMFMNTYRSLRTYLHQMLTILVSTKAYVANHLY